LPQMTSGHLKKLCALMQAGRALVPKNQEFVEPLSAIFPVEAWDVARAVLAGPDVSLQGFIAALAERGSVDFYPVLKSEQVLYRNFNTPEQWPGRQLGKQERAPGDLPGASFG
jgi:molybdopterin-guanine dinucleotide biosynthesis protein A